MIRKIKRDDLMVCAKILKEAYGQTPYNEVFLPGNAEKYILEKYNNCYKDSFAVVNDNSELLAFIFIRISAWSNGPQAIIEEIAVSPLSQNMGIGKDLLKYSCDYINSLGVKSVMIWAKNNERLLNFYKQQGFSVADDYVVMFKNIN